MLFKRIVALSAMLCAVCAPVTAANAAFGFIGPRAIAGLDIGDSNSLIIRLGGAPICLNNPYVFIWKSDPYYADMYAMALSAYASGQPINVYISHCDGAYGKVVRMVQGLVF